MPTTETRQNNAMNRSRGSRAISQWTINSRDSVIAAVILPSISVPQHNPIITKSRLVEDLQDLGVRPGQVLMLHASVKSIGWIVGGPRMVLEAILETLTPTGTLMMLASWEDNPYDLECWPPERRQAYLNECPAYDPATSPADHRELSVLAEYLRTWPESYRSSHPFSYVAVGPKAQYLVANHPIQYRDGPGSPLAKLCSHRGLVLLLGSPLGDITLLHHAEHLADVPDKRIDRYKMPIMQDGQRVWVEIEEFDTTKGIVDWPDNYFETIAKAFLATGHGTTGQVGQARSYLFDAASLNDFGKRWMENNFAKGKITKR